MKDPKLISEWLRWGLMVVALAVVAWMRTQDVPAMEQKIADHSVSIAEIKTDMKRLDRIEQKLDKLLYRIK